MVLHAPASAVAPYIGDATLEPLGADRCRLTAGSWSWTGLAASIARYDTCFDVAGPPELRDAVATLAQRYATAAEPTSMADPVSTADPISTADPVSTAERKDG